MCHREQRTDDIDRAPDGTDILAVDEDVDRDRTVCCRARIRADVAVAARDVGVTVVETEQKTPGEGGELGVVTQCLVEPTDHRPEVQQPAHPAGERADLDVANLLVGGARYQSGVDEFARDGVDVGDSAQLHIGSRCQIDEPVAVVRRHPRERRELLRGDRPTEQPDPCQCTVGGSMRGEHSGTTIGGRARRRRPRPISGDISSGTTGYGATRRGVGVGHTIQGRCRAGARTAR